jgi:hypothetical protein
MASYTCPDCETPWPPDTTYRICPRCDLACKWESGRPSLAAVVAGAEADVARASRAKHERFLAYLAERDAPQLLREARGTS